MDDLARHRNFYSKHADSYDSTWAFCAQDEHYVAVSVLSGLIGLFDVESVLDVGCGTGRGLAYLRGKYEKLDLSGLEPVTELRNQCVAKGLDLKMICDGDARHLPFEDGSFDCVAMFGILHHIDRPELAISEAFRVANKMVFISDHNVYGMGSGISRVVKRSLRRLGMRNFLFWLLTAGKGYHDTDWDGLFYPFSLVDHMGLIGGLSSNVYSISTKTTALDMVKDASHIAVAAIK